MADMPGGPLRPAIVRHRADAAMTMLAAGKASGDRVFEINQQGDCLYLLVSGRIGISIEQDPSSTRFIATLGPGDSFGEMNLLDDQHESKVRTPCPRTRSSTQFPT